MEHLQSHAAVLVSRMSGGIGIHVDSRQDFPSAEICKAVNT
jgi:hypothetical protein